MTEVESAGPYRSGLAYPLRKRQRWAPVGVERSGNCQAMAVASRAAFEAPSADCSNDSNYEGVGRETQQRASENGSYRPCCDAHETALLSINRRSPPGRTGY